MLLLAAKTKQNDFETVAFCNFAFATNHKCFIQKARCRVRHGVYVLRSVHDERLVVCSMDRETALACFSS